MDRMCRNSPTKYTAWTECVGIVLQNTLHGQSMCRNSPTKYTAWTECVGIVLQNTLHGQNV